MVLYLLHVAYLSMSERFNYSYNMAVCVTAGLPVQLFPHSKGQGIGAGTLYGAIWTVWSIMVGYMKDLVSGPQVVNTGVEKETVCMEVCSGSCVWEFNCATGAA